ncbi:hypothetical protein [Andreprevotia chitinilytica]|uniref:hypothetical protein n=1 Tax=Andreprevotia chitinilytica TaxID=396808 RepID=UPI0006911480|nr:hypothetical protein [Andreprevotia chitinilytica]
MKSLKFIIGFVLFLLVGGSALAAQSTVNGAKVTNIYTFNQYGGGDVAIVLDTPPAGCGGIWLTKSDPGYTSNFALIMLAVTTKTPISVVALTDQVWTGTNSPVYCKVFYIQSVVSY